MSQFQVAGAAEILRSAQKDDEYLRYIRNLTSHLIQRTQGVPFWLKWKDHCSYVADLVFLSLTTLSGFQTLGEEYVNIVQVDKSLKSVPSKWKHLMDVFFQTYGCYLILRLHQYSESGVIQSFINQNLSSFSKFIKYLPLFIKILVYFQQLHLVLFYVSGSFYHVSKRVTGIKYVILRRWLTNPRLQYSYKVLGCIAAAQLCLSVISTFSTLRVNSSSEDNIRRPVTNSTENVNSQNQCCLCLERRLHSTATPCGHMFCWSCITSWVQNKEECPLCREKTISSRLVYLQNYE